MNKYLYYRVNDSNDVSIYNICDVTVEGVINCSQWGGGTGQGRCLGLVTRGISKVDGLVKD